MKVSRSQYADFYSEFQCGPLLIGLGAAFCNKFGIHDDFLFTCKDDKEAEKYIFINYHL